MRQYLIKTAKIKVNNIFIIPKLIDEVPSHAKGAQRLKWPNIVPWVPNEEEFPRMCGQDNQTVKKTWEG